MMTLLAKEKRCEKCGATFDCGGLFGCWCRDVAIDLKTLAELRDKYADCLCPSCLHALAVPASSKS